MSLYLYGFVPEDSAAPPADLRGIDGGAVETIEFGGFRGAVSRVSGEDYEETVLSARMKDLAWVGRRGLEHERVVTWYVDQSGILPARLFTLYGSRPSLEADTAARRDRIAELLERFGPLREWHLKVSFDPERVEPHLGTASDEIRELDEQIAAAPPGRGYLLKRKRTELAREIVDAVARRRAEDLYGEVSQLVLDARVLPLPRETPVRVALNAALLARHDDTGRLHRELARRADELASTGLDLEFSGPWAPYRFIPGEDAEGHEAE